MRHWLIAPYVRRQTLSLCKVNYMEIQSVLISDELTNIRAGYPGIPASAPERPHAEVKGVST